MKKLIILLFLFSLLSTNVLAYTDEADYLWAVPALNRWKSRGIIAGYTDGTFKGNNYITKADLMIIANRLNNDVEKDNKRVAYDISENDYFFYDVCTAVNKGIAKVDDNGNIRPREYATREDTMVIFSNLFNLSYSGNSYEYLSEKFIDGKDVSNSNMNKVAGFIEAGFITGYEDGTLRPKNNITRAEVIAMLDKVISDIYKEGNYRNEIVTGSIVINDENVVIKNSEIKGRIFVLDGAKDGLPEIINTNIGQGIISRVGQVNVVKKSDFEAATEYNDEKIYNEPLLGYIKYNETDWTNDDVKATLRLDDDDYKVINNDGDFYYYFERNGEFTFECEKDGIIKTFTATVNNIDKVKPVIRAEITGSSVAIVIVDDQMSAIKTVAYKKGDVSGKNAISGTLIENNVFSVSEVGKYTIAVKDEAGNIGRLVINITEAIPPSELPSTGETTDNTTTPEPPSTGETTDNTTTPEPPSTGETTDNTTTPEIPSTGEITDNTTSSETLSEGNAVDNSN